MVARPSGAHPPAGPHPPAALRQRPISRPHPVDESDPVEAINGRTRDLLETGGEALPWNVLSGPNIFATQAARVERWLEVTGSRRVSFGHTPPPSPDPVRYHGGKAINFDGGLSRAHRLHQRGAPIRASVAPLPD